MKNRKANIWLICMALFCMTLLVSCSSEQKQKVSIIVKNGDILIMNDTMTEIKNGVLVIEGNMIREVGNSSLLEKYRADEVIDAEGGIVIQGMVNTHQHLPMIAFRGLGKEGIENRLQGYFMPLENAKLSRQLIHAATIHECIEIALSGVTTYCDMYYHIDEMAEAMKTIGLRAVLGETVIKFPTVDAPEPFGGLAYAESFIDLMLMII